MLLSFSSFIPVLLAKIRRLKFSRNKYYQSELFKMTTPDKYLLYFSTKNQLSCLEYHTHRYEKSYIDQCHACFSPCIARIYIALLERFSVRTQKKKIQIPGRWMWKLVWAYDKKPRTSLVLRDWIHGSLLVVFWKLNMFPYQKWYRYCNLNLLRVVSVTCNICFNFLRLFQTNIQRNVYIINIVEVWLLNKTNTHFDYSNGELYLWLIRWFYELLPISMLSVNVCDKMQRSNYTCSRVPCSCLLSCKVANFSEYNN